MWQQALFLATEGVEGVAPSHIAAKLALPLGLLLFCGSVFLLLWSNFGAKKGGLIYGVAFFGFNFMIGVFWWFGAPGTPVATGLQNFPGQAPDAYQAHWHPFEAGSARAEFFPASNSLDGFQTPAEYLGKGDQSQEQLENDPMYAALVGDLDQAGSRMVSLFLKIDDTGESRIGGSLRLEYQEAGDQALADAVDNPEDYGRANPFITAAFEDGVLIREDQGVRLVGGTVIATANYVHEESGDTQAFPVDTVPMYAFQEPSLIWFPSAVWTVVSALLFGLCVLGLDRIEHREKREAAEVEEPESLAVPIRQ
jgi:hypothetical protein